MRARFGRIVDRLCVPWGGSLWMTPDGFLSEPPESLGLLTNQATSSPGGLEPVSSAATSGAVVMLGEPGLGKSTSLQGLVRDLPAWESVQAHEHGLAWVDLVEVDATTFDELVTEPLQRLPSVASGEDRTGAPSDGLEQATQPRLTLVLDGVDECPLEPKRLVGRLRRVLSRRDLGRLRLLVGCRTADYSPALHEFLTALLLELRVVELAPLTRANVAALAEDRGVDADAFLAAVGAASAGALAAVPLTLDLLLRLFQQDSRLVGGAVALFEQGVLALADEPDEDRRASELRTGSAHQRVAVAARVCATLVLCGKAAVWTGAASDVPETDVSSGALSGGGELGPAGPFDVSPELVAATLDTALFSSQGPERLGPAHATFASYLTARHLVNHDVAEQQLRSLLVVVNELGHAAIHPALRETAAWLVALAPERTSWLADVDAYNLAVHAAVVESLAVRGLLVRRLLEQAETVVLRDRSWARPRWNLFHSGLAGQLRPVLVAAVAADQAVRPSRYQVQLAIQLAREGGVAGLVGELCEIARVPNWDGWLRSWAVRAAAELDRELAAPRLCDLVPRLDRAADPDDELRGELLEACWPDHLPVDELLAALIPPGNPDLFGAYRSFRLRVMERLREEDLAAVLEWARGGMRSRVARSSLEAQEVPADRAFSADEADDSHPQPEDTGVFRPVDQPEHQIELLEALTDRALTGPGASGRVEAVAALLGPRLAAYDAVVPAPVDLIDATGQEPPDVRAFRRDLVVALLKITKDEREADLLVYGWRERRRQALRRGQSQDGIGDGDLARANSTSLVRQDDLGWLLELEAAADDEAAARLHILITAVFTPLDGGAQELAWQRKGTRIWDRVFARYFEAVDLRGQAAQRARTRQEPMAATTEGTPWAGRNDFIPLQRGRLAAAASGDATAFWQLCHFLQVAPDTGLLRPRHDDDVTTWPGIAVLEDDWLDSLLTAAKQYLITESPHADEWLGPERWDRRAWAGYLALALLARHRLLDTVANTTWVTWAPAILWFWAIPMDTGDRGLKRKLLAQVAAIAPDALIGPVVRILRGGLEAHTQPSELELLDAAWTGPLADALAPELSALVNDLLSDGARSSGLADALAQAAARLQATGASEQPTATDTPEQQAARRELQQAQDHLQSFIDTVELIARLLVKSADERGIDACRHLIEAVPARHQSIPLRSAGLHAAKVLLQANARVHWPAVLATARADATWSDDLMAQLASDWADPWLIDQLDEASLAELYVWIAERYPPETDVVIPGAHWVSPEEQVRHWREYVVQALANRGSVEAVRQLAGLVRRWPDRLALKGQLLHAEERQQETAWIPPTPAELLALLADRRRRLVRTGAELTDVLVDAIHDIAQSLPEHGQLLWDMRRIPRQQTIRNEDGIDASGVAPDARRTQYAEVWRPKNEHALSAYLKEQLQLRLAAKVVFINREVLVRQTSTSGGGDRVDLLVEAIALPGTPTGAIAAEDPGFYGVRVVIEVKGCWHEQLTSAMRAQLADDYLGEASTKHGVYLVGWFPVGQWNDTEDRRRSVTAQRDREQVAMELDRQATGLSRSLSLDLRCVVIDIPRLIPSTRNA
jgi:NACHT domain